MKDSLFHLQNMWQEGHCQMGRSPNLSLGLKRAQDHEWETGQYFGSKNKRYPNKLSQLRKITQQTSVIFIGIWSQKGLERGTLQRGNSVLQEMSLWEKESEKSCLTSMAGQVSHWPLPVHTSLHWCQAHHPTSCTQATDMHEILLI